MQLRGPKCGVSNIVRLCGPQESGLDLVDMASTGRAIEAGIDKHPPLPWGRGPTGGGSSRALLAWAAHHYHDPATHLARHPYLVHRRLLSLDYAHSFC
jgi:hypothetical protein